MGATYSRETIAEVLNATDIREIIAARIELQSAGGYRHKALCPFHGEKTPSFIVDTQRQSFKCFGCGKGGDAISFLMEYDGLTFVEAIAALADRANMTLPQAQSNPGDEMRSQLAALNKFAAEFFRERLAHPQHGAAAREYLASRSLSTQSEKTFGIGFGPDDYNTFWRAAVAKGFKEPLIAASGLAREGDRGGLYDFFRGRLMVPIRDVRGRVIAFGGRDLTGTSKAKYVNTPENTLYKKSQVLYGIYEARDTMRTEKRAIIVEGYFDAMRCVDAGIGNVVATCGTALTAQQARLLRRYVPEVVLVYDGDEAGLQAASRAIGVLVAEELAVRVLALPESGDPDDFIRAHGADEFRALVESAPDFVRFYIQAQADRAKSAEGRTAVARELLAIIGMIGDAIRRDEYIKTTAAQLGVDAWTLRREFESQQESKNVRAQIASDAPANVVTFRPLEAMRSDAEFIAALLAHNALLELAREGIDRETLGDSEVENVLRAVLSGVHAATMRELESDEAVALYAAATTIDAPGEDSAREIVTKRLNRMRKELMEAEQADLTEAIRRAEAAGDKEEARRLFEKHVNLSRARDASGSV